VVSHEFIAQLESVEDEVRWLVRDPASDALHVVCEISDTDPAWLHLVDDATAPWIGFSHPRIGRVHAMAWLDGRLVITIDDDRGPDFINAAAMLADSPADREGWVVAQLIAIADGLTAMSNHQRGFIHRRLDPHRMIIDTTGRARLRAPIGVMSLGPMPNYTGTTGPLGDMHFFSPEQCMGQELTQASDVFALAASLFTVLSGRPPFTGESDFDTLKAIISAPPPPCPTRAPGLDRVLARAFAKRPAERYPDPAAFAAELYECVPDAGDYDAVISDRVVAWRATAPEATPEVRRGPSCAKRWEDLEVGFDDTIRHCTSCQQPVVHVRSLAAALPLLGKHCVAFRPGPK
jgi:serine/threonine-protein kinase